MPERNEDLAMAAVTNLRTLQQGNDPEGGHVDADNVLCELLSNLGYGDVVEEFEKIYKWYA